VSPLQVIRKRTTFRVFKYNDELVSSSKAEARNVLRNVIVGVFVKLHIDICLSIVTDFSLETLIDLEDNCFVLMVLDIICHQLVGVHLPLVRWSWNGS
jgi:hypothetical protein